MTHRRLRAVLALVLIAVTAACGGSGSGGPGTLTVYSGRSKDLVAPIIEAFSKATGIETNVRYAGTPELAATLLEEGEGTKADVFFAQDAGALGQLGKAGLLAPLPQALLDKVPPGYRSASGTWTGTSGRARVVVHNVAKAPASSLPSTIDGFVDPAWKGRLGWAPTNASFQSFVTGYRILRGEAAAEAWLRGIKANEPRRFDGNIPIVEAAAAGEIDAGFVNHYYLYELQAHGKAAGAANHLLAPGDPGSLVNVAGVGVIAGTERSVEAQRFAEYLLGPEAQRAFADDIFEVPLVAGTAPKVSIPSLSSLPPPAIDLNRLEDLAATKELLLRTGVL